MIKLNSDLSSITGISKLTLDNISDKAILCISHAVQEMLLSKESMCAIDIGIGKLYIKLYEDGVRYKFLPSSQLEKNVAFTVANKKSPLIIEADTALKERLESTYKRLL